MAFVEFCDNVHCMFNRDHACSAPEVEFDENACCLTVKYDEMENPAPKNQFQTPEHDKYLDDFRKEPKNKWIKYI